LCFKQRAKLTIMINLHQSFLTKNLASWGPILLLFISVLNEFDFNYLGMDFFSFNFAYILIFYWSLKRIDFFGYGMVCISGVINDVVVGLPIGTSSLSYMLICVAATYLRSITLRPDIFKDWFFFLLTISIVNSIVFSILNLIFFYNLEYFNFVINTFFTFSLYILFSYLFNIYYKLLIGKSNV